MRLFSKINYNEYNNKLEKILEEKDFSADAKNLLLSMLYKIENGYNDYLKVKKEGESKDIFIQNILEIIKEDCIDIRVVTPYTKESMELEEKQVSSIVDVDKETILVYANEKDILKALIKMNILEKYYRCKYEKRINFLDNSYYEKAIREFIFNGIQTDKVEVIRDFDGWSWNNSLKDLNEIEINLIFQIIILLQIDYKNENFYREFYENILKGNGDNFYSILYIMIFTIISEKNKKIREEMQERFQYLLDFEKLVKDKNVLLSKINERKKELILKIGKIDEIKNNKFKLKEEYDIRNAKLPNSKKIFSPSFLMDILKKEKNDYLNEINKLNNFLEPNNFVKRNKELNIEKQLLKSVVDNLSNKELKRKYIIKLQEEFLIKLNQKINQKEVSKDYIENVFLNFRYYCLLKVDNEQCIKDLQDEELNEHMKKTMNNIIDKSIDKGIIINVSNSASLCYNVLKYIFESKIIDLKEIQFKIIKKEKQEYTNEILYSIIINIYDTSDKEESHQVIVDNLNQLNIKLNKKVSLFLK